MAFILDIEQQRESLKKILDSLPGEFYLNGNNQIYYYSMRGWVENEEERKINVNLTDFRGSCKKLSADKMVDILRDPEQTQKSDFIISKFKDRPSRIKYRNLLDDSD